jgi:hypothetical protein
VDDGEKAPPVIRTSRLFHSFAGISEADFRAENLFSRKGRREPHFRLWKCDGLTDTFSRAAIQAMTFSAGISRFPPYLVFDSDFHTRT